MEARPAYRDRHRVEVSVLDALADRPEEGLSVLELRARVDAPIDRLERALTDLKADGLIRTRQEGDRTVILPESGVVQPEDEDEDDPSVLTALRRRLSL